jgi:tetratricopeptide (TPR) repeat protein
MGVPGYEILRELGRGGMGVVYEARQIRLKRLVALKMILAGAHAGPHVLERFRSEAEAVARLRHPNIVQIHEVNEHDGLPFLSLELVEGGSLETMLAAGLPTPTEAARLVEILARAVHYAHKQGILHRDLKPANVLLTTDGTLKITDFGLAKHLGAVAGPTRSGALVGTPEYMAPELLRHESSANAPPVDVYALGAILYQILTGRPPFRGDTVLQTLEQVRSQEPLPPGKLRARLPRDLETICLKTLHKDKRRRYPSALALAEDLRRFRDGEPVHARRSTPAERLLKWARRRPAVTALAVLSGVLVLTLVVGAVWTRERERRRLIQQRAYALLHLQAGDSALSIRAWPEARGHFALAVSQSQGEQALADLALRARDGQAEAERQLDAAALRRQADERFQDFNRQYEDALFYGVGSVSGGAPVAGMEPASSLATCERAARRALTLAGISGGSERFSPRAKWDERERAVVDGRCYHLVLILADAVAGRAAPPLDDGGRYREALRTLDLALRLGPPGRAYHLRKADFLNRLGKQAEALREQDQAAAQPPASAPDFFLVGHAEYERGRIRDAKDAFNSALAIEPAHFWAQLYLAVCCLRTQDWSGARAGLTTCTIQRPNLVWPHLFLARAHQELNALAAAEADLGRAEGALSANPAGEAAYALAVYRGYLRYRQGRLDLAALEFRRAADSNPGQYEAALNLAMVYQKQNKSAESAEALRHAIGLKPPPVVLAMYHAERGLNLFRDGRFTDAIASCHNALAAVPECALAHGVLAQSLLKTERYLEASASFDDYLKYGGPPLADIYSGRGLARMRRQDFLGAADDYTRAWHLRPDAEILTHRGWAYFFSDAFRPALRDFDHAIKTNAPGADPYAGRGLAQVMLGQYKQAAEDAKEALRRGPATPEMMHNIACIFAQAALRADRDAAHAPLAAAYRDQACQAVRKTLDMLPSSKRQQFWRDKVLPDKALDPVRSHPVFLQVIAAMTVR